MGNDNVLGGRKRRLGNKKHTCLEGRGKGEGKGQKKGKNDQ